jgi:hypothetical protein
VSTSNDDELTALLDEGWDIAGYTVNLMAAGAQHINILLRRENELVNFWIVVNGNSEVGRGKKVLAPHILPPKRGFFG